MTETLTIPTGGDCKAGNTGGTDEEEEEEGDDGEDVDDCDAAAESHRFRTMKGDERFLLPNMQVLAEPFKIFLSSRKEFRKDYDRAFKASGWGNDEYQEDRRGVRVLPARGRRPSVRAEQQKRAADSGSHVPQDFTRRHWVCDETMASATCSSRALVERIWKTTKVCSARCGVSIEVGPRTFTFGHSSGEVAMIQVDQCLASTSERVDTTNRKTQEFPRERERAMSVTREP